MTTGQMRFRHIKKEKNRPEKLLKMVEMELEMKNLEEKDYGYDNMPELRRANIR